MFDYEFLDYSAYSRLLVSDPSSFEAEIVENLEGMICQVSIKFCQNCWSNLEAKLYILKERVQWYLKQQYDTPNRVPHSGANQLPAQHVLGLSPQVKWLTCV